MRILPIWGCSPRRTISRSVPGVLGIVNFTLLLFPLAAPVASAVTPGSADCAIHPYWDSFECCFVIIGFLAIFGLGGLLTRNSRLKRENAKRAETESSLKAANDRLWRSEYLLNQTGRIARVGGWALDLATNQLEWTEETKRIHEVGDDYRPTVETAINFYHPDDRSLIAAAVEKAAEQNEPFELELRLDTAGGRRRWVRAIGKRESPIGRPPLVVGTFQDITERKLADEERTKLLAAEQSARSLAEEAASLKNRLLGMAAHDLRNPLQIIGGYAEILLTELKETATTEHKKILKRILRAQERMARLVNDYLDLSILDSHQVKLHLKRVDIGGFLEELHKNNAIVARAKGVELRLEGGEGLPEARIDPQRFDQALENLLTNAIKYSPSGAVVTLAAVRKNGHLELSVADKGAGISMEGLAKLFTDFGTAGTRPTADEKSIGLGLMIAKKIIEAHGGTIGVESVVGTGTIFRVSIPLN